MATVRARESFPRTDSLDSDVPNSESSSKEKLPHVSVKESTESLPLGTVASPKKFWWQRGEKYDPNAIATQVLLKFTFDALY
jgi:hypothetical protein